MTLQGPPFNPGDLIVTRLGYYGIVLEYETVLTDCVVVMLGNGLVVRMSVRADGDDIHAVLLPDSKGRQSFPELLKKEKGK